VASAEVMVEFGIWHLWPVAVMVLELRGLQGTASAKFLCDAACSPQRVGFPDGP
jgi:hypothetical protein